MRYTKYFLLTIGVILFDQIIKLWVFNTFPFEGYEHPYLRLGNWFKLHYITNEGMAFGIKLAGDYGKLVLSLFRLLAMVGISYYLYVMAKKNMHPGFLWSIALILGGAMGNVVDSTFYGVFLDLPTSNAPMLWFHGRVIDMFYVDICNCLIPDWVPVFGGSYYPLWPIFNFADASIFVGVAVILLYQKRFFPEKETVKQPTTEPQQQQQ
ncbi:MAG: lipoprotein signal peptidase [Cytophaga sp.]|uniref:lipoprotein signal peptidase n=1 Tax=Cytophaga sp. TaxID=29535 RepID=UPI003F7F3A11